MVDWVTILDSQVDPNAPITSELMTALRDNPIAIAEGASGATRITDAALDTGAATTLGTDWVQLRVAGATYGAVGTYVFARASADVLAGDTVAGSDLLATSAARSVPYNTSASFSSSGGLSGTWRAMGLFDFSVNASVSGETETVLYGATLWLRIS